MPTFFLCTVRRSRRGSHFLSGLGPERVPLSGGGLASGGRNTTASTADMTPSSGGYTGSFSNSNVVGHFMGSPPNSGGFMTNASSNGGGYIIGSGGHMASPPPTGGVFMGSPPNGSFMTSSNGNMASPPHGGFMASSSGHFASPPTGGFMTSSNGNMASPSGGLNAMLRERFAWGGRAESSSSFNGEGCCLCWLLLPLGGGGGVVFFGGLVSACVIDSTRPESIEWRPHND